MNTLREVIEHAVLRATLRGGTSGIAEEIAATLLAR